MRFREVGIGAAALGIVAVSTALLMPPVGATRANPRLSNELPASFSHISHELDGDFDRDMQAAGEQFEREIARLHGRDVETPVPEQPQSRRFPGAYHPSDQVSETEPASTLAAWAVALLGGGFVFGISLLVGLVLLCPTRAAETPTSEPGPAHGP